MSSTTTLTAEQIERQRVNRERAIAIRKQKLAEQQRGQQQPSTSTSQPSISTTTSFSSNNNNNISTVPSTSYAIYQQRQQQQQQVPQPRPQITAPTPTNYQQQPLQRNNNIVPSNTNNNNNNNSFKVKDGPTIELTCSLITLDRFQVVQSMFEPDWVGVFRQIPSRQYDGATKSNTFELRHYNTFVQTVTESFGQRAKINHLPVWIKRVFNQALSGRPMDPTILPNLDFSRISPEISDKLYDYQKEGIGFVISHRGRALIADEMGLGKTVQSLVSAYYYRNDWPLLIVCPSSVKETWSRAIGQWCPSICEDNVRVLNKQSDINNLPTSQFSALICTYDILGNILEPVKNYKCGVVILDESHSIKDFKAQRTRNCREVCKKAKRILLLSGTPALSRPAELYTQISILQPDWIKSMPYKTFGLRYCDGKEGKFNFEMKGATNTKELSLLLQQTVMIRRMKSDVSNRLPTKNRQLRVIDKEIIRQQYKQAIEAANMMGASTKQLSSRDEDILQLYEKTGVAKAEAIAEYIVDHIKGDDDCKTLIFAHHSYVLDVIDQALTIKKLPHIRIDGSTTSTNRQQRVDEFQQSDTCRVALLSITAANTGITLTAANTVFFAELHWTPATLIQAEDRAHRIGQLRTVNVYYLVAKGTVDDNLWNMIKSKLTMLQSVNLANENLKNTNTMHVGDSEADREKLARQNASYDLTDYFEKSSSKTPNTSIDELALSQNVVSEFCAGGTFDDDVVLTSENPPKAKRMKSIQ